jgi:hypothetical protein
MPRRRLNRRTSELSSGSEDPDAIWMDHYEVHAPKSAEKATQKGKRRRSTDPEASTPKSTEEATQKGKDKGTGKSSKKRSKSRKRLLDEGEMSSLQQPKQKQRLGEQPQLVVITKAPITSGQMAKAIQKATAPIPELNIRSAISEERELQA